MLLGALKAFLDSERMTRAELRLPQRPPRGGSALPLDPPLKKKNENARVDPYYTMEPPDFLTNAWDLLASDEIRRVA